MKKDTLLEINDLCFSYNKDKPLFKNFNLELR
jgi:ABC-type transport system involved in cytochrome bd biosynthesis fused ATPase/permease subunit